MHLDYIYTCKNLNIFTIETVNYNKKYSLDLFIFSDMPAREKKKAAALTKTLWPNSTERFCYITQTAVARGQKDKPANKQGQEQQRKTSNGKQTGGDGGRVSKINSNISQVQQSISVIIDNRKHNNLACVKA